MLMHIRQLGLGLALGVLAACNIADPETPPVKSPAASQPVSSSPAQPSATSASSPTNPATHITRPGAPANPPAATLAPEPVLTPSPGPYAEIIQIARQDLAQRLGIPGEAIRLVSVTPDEFPAGDLGCPAPGRTPRPIPALVSGQSIVLDAQGRQYTYHARRSQVVFCGP
jgi:hypothetical protein